ncbi:MAG: hypothetical protein GXO63_01945 [Candidatus Micrarchaeota archaeon]|nr:hypothetical protein [Candidatus Micrarchaeota archaeon]
MRYLLPVVLAVFVSGCISFDNSLVSGFVTQKISDPDMNLEIQYYPEKVFAGKKFKMNFLVEAKKELRNLKIDVFDPCIFSGDNPEGTVENLPANYTRNFKFTFTAENTEVPIDCKIRYSISYETDSVAMIDLVVLSDTEYMERQRTGTMNELSVNVYSTDSKLRIDPVYTSEVPAVTGSEVYLRVDYSAESGVREADITITFPEFVEEAVCDGKKIGNEYTKTKEYTKKVKIYEGSGGRTLCVLKVKTDKPISSGKIVIKGSYKYEKDDYINVKVVPK